MVPRKSHRPQPGKERDGKTQEGGSNPLPGLLFIGRESLVEHMATVMSKHISTGKFLQRDSDTRLRKKWKGQDPPLLSFIVPDNARIKSSR